MADDAATTEVDPLSDPREQRVLLAALNSFRQYRQAAHYNITHLRRQSFYSLPAQHLDLLCEEPFDIPSFLRQVDAAIDSNADLAEAIYNNALQMFDIDPTDPSNSTSTTPGDMDKAQSTLKQLYRDWSSEGQAERTASYTPVLEALETYLPATPPQRHQYQILVPGAGLGRLLFDIVGAGYTASGNEISYHQTMASAYILNACQRAGQHGLFPWVQGFSNHFSREDQLQKVKVPDVLPAEALHAAGESEVHWSQRMSMASGDFCVVYREADYEDVYDAVTTCFFIDTAPNLIHYIETVKHCLKPGGLWINHGPLQWHFESTQTPAEAAKDEDGASLAEEKGLGSTKANEGIGEPGSFELTDVEVRQLLVRLGFEVVMRGVAPGGRTGYIQNPQSMLQTAYRPSFWVAKKL
ncbi:uncharacterized protein LTR77_009781 [Saxophila tyrrhenica]|uniref:carnosine N-methyltransferase n=1 Tax=Saxophila tyrrhenica TaxID=1690608 RepID=A0AAV9NXT6_9PEZI|nr:hypothetical protein LTR77_009781 [Saxophila tyrrhenica]